MVIGDNFPPGLSEATSGARMRGTTNPGVEPRQGAIAAGQVDGDDIRTDGSRDLIMLAAAAENPDRQVRLEQLRLQVQRGEYSVEPAEVSRAIVKDLLGR